jgi:hypothetical protein
MLGSAGGVQEKRSDGTSNPSAPSTMPTSTAKFWTVVNSAGLTVGDGGTMTGPASISESS